jgi:hypothetical protein
MILCIQSEKPMNKLIKIIIFLIIIGGTTSAQNSGYQGKKFSLHYNLFASNAFLNPNEFGNHGIFSFNTLHHVDLDACIARRLTLGLSFEYIHNSFSYKKTFNYEIGNYSSYFHSNSIGKMEVYGIGLFLKIFTKGSIAPLGTYVKPQLSLLFYKVYPGNPITTSGLYFNEITDGFVNKSPYKTVAISLEVGQNRLLFSRMFIDYGVRVGILPTIAFISNDNTMHDDAAQVYLKYVPLKRIGAQYLFNIKLGVGVLLF